MRALWRGGTTPIRCPKRRGLTPPRGNITRQEGGKSRTGATVGYKGSNISEYPRLRTGWEMSQMTITKRTKKLKRKKMKFHTKLAKQDIYVRPTQIIYPVVIRSEVARLIWARVPWQ